MNKNKIKLWYFTDSNIAPSETFIFDLIKELKQFSDIDLTIIGGKKRHNIKGISNLNTISTGYSEIGYKNSFRIYKIGQVIGNKGNHLKYKYRQSCAQKNIVKNTKGIRTPDVAYIEYATSAVLCYRFLVKRKIPFIVHVHGFDITSSTNDKTYLKELLNVFKNAKAIITPSMHLKRLAIQLGCDANKIKSIYPITNFNGILDVDLNARKKLTPTISFLGRLTPKKNPIALIYSFNIVLKEFPNATLNILGDGELKEELVELINKLKLQNNVKLWGSVNRKTAFQVLHNSHIYAQHSVTALNGDQEGFPVSLAEASAHSLPLVSTIHSGITENIIEGKTGYLVQENDFERMADKIIYLLKNPKYAEEMGIAGKEHIMRLCEPGKRVKLIHEQILKALDC